MGYPFGLGYRSGYRGGYRCRIRRSLGGGHFAQSLGSLPQGAHHAHHAFGGPLREVLGEFHKAPLALLLAKRLHSCLRLTAPPSSPLTSRVASRALTRLPPSTDSSNSFM